MEGMIALINRREAMHAWKLLVERNAVIEIGSTPSISQRASEQKDCCRIASTHSNNLLGGDPFIIFESTHYHLGWRASRLRCVSSNSDERRATAG
jgi:hypothetical protein